jgi:hypothetical protein
MTNNTYYINTPAKVGCLITWARGLLLKLYIPHLAISLFLIFGIGMNTVNAQACCSGGVPLGGSIGLGTAESKRLELMFTYDYNSINTLMDENEILRDDTRSRNTQSTILEVNYGLNQRITFTAILPYVRQVRVIQSHENERNITSVQGFGDALFLVKLNLLTDLRFAGMQWVLGIGPKLPTGRTNHLNNDGLALAADMQPGSGSLDGILWSYFQYSKFNLTNLSLFTVSTYRHSGENKNYNQSQVIKFGNEYQLSMGFNYSIYRTWNVDIFSMIRYRYQTEDMIDGSVFPSSGGEWVYVIPGIGIEFSPGISMRFSADLPLYRNLIGTQLTTNFKFTAALTVQLPKFNPK